MYALTHRLYTNYNKWYPYGMDEGDPYQQHAIEVVNESVGEPVLGNYMGNRTAVLNAKTAFYDFIAANEPFLNLVNDDAW